MIEKVILVDKNDNEVGTMEKQEAHVKGLLHRAFSVFIFNDKNELLYKEEQLINIILEDYGRTPVVATQDKTKKQRTPQKEDYLRKMGMRSTLKKTIRLHL